MSLPVPLPHDDAPERPPLGAERVALMSGIGLAAACWLVLFALSPPRFYVTPDGPAIDWRPGLLALAAALTSFVLAVRLVRLDHRADRKTTFWIDVGCLSLCVALCGTVHWMFAGASWLLDITARHWPVSVPVMVVLGLAIGGRLLIYGIPDWMREATGPADQDRRSAADDHHP